MRIHLSVLLVSLLAPWFTANAQTIAPTPADGDTTITLSFVGTTIPIAGTPPAGDSVAIFAAPSGTTPPVCSAAGTAIPLAPNTSNLVLPGAKTTLLLQNPLAEGQLICAVLTPPASAPGTPPTFAPVTVGAPASAPVFDWGLVRAYFTLGALTSQERDQFSHEDLFLAFRLDKSYFNAPTSSDSGKARFKPGLNTFFETRLTSLPVAVQNCTPSLPGVTPVVTCSNASSSAAAPTVASPDAQAFLNSQKSARLQFGLYVPVMLNRWSVAPPNGSQSPAKAYALFVGPLIKTGFDTTLNGLNQTQQGGATPANVQPIGNSSEFYKFYDYGFRLGHVELNRSPTVAPSIISYLDVTWGRFSNLASLLCDTSKYTYNPGTNTCAPGTVATVGTLPWARDMRMNVEGLLEVPGTHGFSVGFSTNVVFDPLGHQGTGTLKHIRPNDDLRFLFAYKFDISKIAAKLAPQFGN